ncbi:peptidylprolyl isomerase [Psychrosphaera aquimarina]|uniref:Peptidyl-prolyl cis-trans isomerase n=1 Tax=Psychrosphaera aquimarina TaxID=2044854 RepID=A0ABU3QVS0_9GAMM|nr:peptidylprolyl isomerase [Psychrosphaera aquimarina]MDU0111531.1 peptidylprolyl isomerase [Psychrosphaera aquimarina]
MKRFYLLSIWLLFVTLPTWAQQLAKIETNLGDITIAFYQDDAPATVAHFKSLITENWYNNKTFYRVVKGHVIQAGSGDDDDVTSINRRVKAEFNKNPHILGSVGLARSEDPNSGSTEFYICDATRSHLDGKYTVFAQVVNGLDVVKKISNVQVKEVWLGDNKQVAFHQPSSPVVIHKITLIDM